MHAESGQTHTSLVLQMQRDASSARRPQKLAGMSWDCLQEHCRSQTTCRDCWAVHSAPCSRCQAASQHMWLPALASCQLGCCHMLLHIKPKFSGRLGGYCTLLLQVRAVGPGKLVLDLSCRKRDGKYFVVTDRWQNFSELEVDEQTLQQLGQSCAEFLVHGVDVEGKQLGVDKDLVQLLSASSPKPVTYAGGVRNMVRLPCHLHCRSR